MPFSFSNKEKENPLKKILELTNKLSTVLLEKNKLVQNEMVLQKKNKDLLNEIETLKKDLEISKRQNEILKKQVNEYQTQISNINGVKTDLIKCKSEMNIILRQFKPIVTKPTVSKPTVNKFFPLI